MLRSTVPVLFLLLPLLAHADLQSARDAQARGDLQAAAAEFRRLADAGDPVAQANLGYMYYVGEGVNQNYAEAVNWYRRAAVQGERDAQYNLAVAYAFGEGVKQDLKEAATWYRRAAEQGHMVAQYSLGLSYLYGEGVALDPKEARKWFRTSADLGYARAQVQLGSMYHTGDGVPQDMTEAVKWYRLAADKGDAIAQYNLGSLYRSGKGVPQDYNQARRWFRMAADQGYAAAQNELASLERATAGAARAGTPLRPTPPAEPEPAVASQSPPPAPVPAPAAPAPTPEPVVSASPTPSPAALPAPERQEPNRQEMFSVDRDELLTLEKDGDASRPSETATPETPSASTASGAVEIAIGTTPASPSDTEFATQVVAAADSDAGAAGTEAPPQTDSTTSDSKGIGGFFRRLFKPTSPEEAGAETTAAEVAAVTAGEESAAVAPATPEQETMDGPAGISAPEDSTSGLMAMEDMEPQVAESPPAPEPDEAVADSGAPDASLAGEPEDSETEEAATEGLQATTEPPKKRGFLSRLFGRDRPAEEAEPETGAGPAHDTAETTSAPVPEAETPETAMEPGPEAAPAPGIAYESTVTEKGWPLPGPEQQSAEPAPESQDAEAAPSPGAPESPIAGGAEDAAPEPKKPGFFSRLFGGRKENAETAPAESEAATVEEASVAGPQSDQETAPEPGAANSATEPVSPALEAEAPAEEPVAAANADMPGDSSRAAESSGKKHGGFFRRLFGSDTDSAEVAAAEPQETVAMAKPDAEVLLPDTAESDLATESLPPAGDVDPAKRAQAVEDLRAGNYERALTALRSLAGQGDPESQFHLGSLLHQGLGTQRDVAAAAAWYRRAAQQGNAEAQYSLGNMYLMGEGVEQDDAQAAAWYEKAAAQGHDAARHNLENVRRVAEQEKEPAMEPAGEIESPEEDAVAESQPDAAPPEKKSFLSRLFGGKDEAAADAPESGSEPAPAPEPETGQAAADLSPAETETPSTVDEPATAEAENPPAETSGETKKQGFFGRLFGGGKAEVPAEPTAAAPESEPARETTEPPSAESETEAAVTDATYQRGLELTLAENAGAEEKQEAFNLFRAAAEQGHALAQYRVGVAFAYGEGVTQDLAQAAEWYRRAALQGYATAQRNLGVMYMNGEGVEKNRPLALAWFTVLADAGNPMDRQRRDALMSQLNDDEREQAETLALEIRSRTSNQN
jgi:TPR repeat protein